VSDLAAWFDSISLDELNQRAALLTRVDAKYIVDLETLGALVDAVHRDFLVLEIGRRRVFAYDTVYVDSDLNVFEVKLKGLRGNTVKHQLPVAAADHGRAHLLRRYFTAEGVAR
jgi:hypothetical protein